MAIVDLGLMGSAQEKVGSTTLTVLNTTGATIPAGTLLVLAITLDNPASTTAPTCTPSAGTGVTTWTQRGTPTGSGVTTTAGAGIWGYTFTGRTTVSIAAGDTLTVVGLSVSVVAKAMVVRGYSGVADVSRADSAVATSTAGTPAPASTGAPGRAAQLPVSGDLVIGTIHGENSVAPTGDSDTLNGSWSSVVSVFTSGSTAATNVVAGIQSKVITADGSQTFNATTANDSVAFLYALVPDTTSMVASDDFNRADGALGSNWVATSTATSLTILSNQMAAGSVVSAARWAAAAVTKSVFSQFRYIAGTFVGPCVAMPGFIGTLATAGPWYFFRVNSTTQVSISLKGDQVNTHTALATVSYNIVAGDIMRLEYDGTTLTAKINDVTVITHTPTSPLSLAQQPYVGANVQTTAFSGVDVLDDFAGGDIVAASGVNTANFFPVL